MSKTVRVILCSVLITVCGGFAAKGDAERAVDQFHRMLTAHEYTQIYEAADGVFKAATTESELTRILQDVSDKLGAVRSATETGVFSQEQVGTNAGTYLRLTYNTEFDHGHATETFTWRVASGQVRLAGYHIASPQP